MGVIAKGMELVGSKGRQKVTALFDSGASYSFIERSLAERLTALEKLATPLRFEMAEKGKIVQAEERVTLDFYMDGHRFSDEFLVLPNLAEQAIIGVLTMQKWRFTLDFEKEEVIIRPDVTRLRFI